MENNEMTENSEIMIEGQEQEDEQKRPSVIYSSDPHSRYGDILLASGILHGGILYDRVIVTEWDGDDEDILAARGTPVYTRFDKIYTKRIKSLESSNGGSVTNKETISGLISEIPAPDRMQIMIATRCLSYGNMLPVTTECEKCTDTKGNPTPIKRAINLDGLKIKHMKDGSVREYADKLPRSGHVINWEIMTGASENWLMNARSKVKTDTQIRVTLGLLARIKKIDDVDVIRDNKKFIAMLKGWPSYDRRWLVHRFIDIEGDVNTDIDFACPKCGYEFSDEVDIYNENFFAPTILT